MPTHSPYSRINATTTITIHIPKTREGKRGIPTIVNQKNWNLRIATRARRSHRTGTEYNVNQNTLESVAFICRCGWTLAWVLVLVGGEVHLRIRIPILIVRLDRSHSTNGSRREDDQRHFSQSKSRMPGEVR